MKTNLLKTTSLNPLSTVLLRNCGLVPAENLCRALRCEESELSAYAFKMGLTPDADRKWLERGYQTIIRNNWNLMPKEQIADLLGTGRAEFERLLKEEDFLSVKLGESSAGERIEFSAPSSAEEQKLKRVKEIVSRMKPVRDNAFEFRYPAVKESGRTCDGIRIVSSFAGSCGDFFLRDNGIGDDYLKLLQTLQINGLWFHALLSDLAPDPFDEAVSKGYQIRLKNLNRLIERAEKFGIGIYLYLNEPRCRTDEFFCEGREHLRGARDGGCYALCTSVREVKDYLTQSVRYLAEHARGLGGIITITASENLTNCFSRSEGGTSCPRCRTRGRAETVIEVNNLIEKGLRQARSEARLIAWNWGQQPGFGFDERDNEEFVRGLDGAIALMCVSEDCLRYSIGGKEQELLDYSISLVGPSEKSVKLWNAAHRIGREIFAKVQINNSWELASVPFLPVFPTFIRHLKRLCELGVKNYMLCWTLGSYPGGGMKLASEDLSRSEEEILRAFLIGEYGEENREGIARAVRLFSEAFENFPFCLSTLYYAPQNFSSAAPFYPERTGKKATMIGFPYDDLRTWIEPYRLGEYLEKLDALILAWEDGLRLLPLGGEENLRMLREVSEAGRISFKSLRNHCLFVAWRDRLLEGVDIGAVLRDEASNTEEMMELCSRNAFIGFEASNHYLFCRNNFIEKLINLRHLTETLH